MARGRLITRTLGSSRKFADLAGKAGKLGEFAQTLYPLIVANSDDFGRMSGDAFTVKYQVFPTSPRREADFEAALSAMEQSSLIQRYECDGTRVLQVEKFEEHQPNLHKRVKSRFSDPEMRNLPEPPGDSGNSPENPGSRAGAETNRNEPKRNELSKASSFLSARNKTGGPPPDPPPEPTRGRFEFSPTEFESLFARIREVTGEPDNARTRALYRGRMAKLGTAGMDRALSSTRQRKADHTQAPLLNAGAYLNKACQDIAAEMGIDLGMRKGAAL